MCFSSNFNSYLLINIFTARKRSLRRLCFYRCLSVHRGGVRGCSQGGRERGCSRGGACVVALGGVHGCSRGGMHGCSRGRMCGCSWGGMHGFFDEIRSMSGRYASYWNAFLFNDVFLLLLKHSLIVVLVTTFLKFPRVFMLILRIFWLEMKH